MSSTAFVIYAVLGLLALNVSASTLNTCCYTQLIRNGGFQEGTCRSPFCIFTKRDFKDYMLPGWKPDQELEVGKSNIYSSEIPGQSYLVELQVSKSECIQQTFQSCGEGQYVLLFDHAARTSTSLSNNKFSVKINGSVVKTISPSNYKAQATQLIVKLNSGQNTITFCGSGSNSDRGGLIDNVSLHCAGY